MSKSKKTSAKTAKSTKPAAKKTGGKPAGEKKPVRQSIPKRVTLLDAAAEVLKRSREPMDTKSIVARAAELGLWSSPAGKTPHATLYSAIIREIGLKKAASRFRKADRGKFEFISAK